MRVTRGIGVSQWWLELSLGRVLRAIIDGPNDITIVVLIVFEGKALILKTNTLYAVFIRTLKS